MAVDEDSSEGDVPLPPPEVTLEVVRQKRHRRKRALAVGREQAEAKRAARVLDLRMSGYSAAEIGATMGLTAQQVSTIIRKTTGELVSEKAQMYVELQGRRLEALLRSVWARAAEQGDLEAVEQARKCIADLRAMYGLDVPKRAEISGPGGSPLEIKLAAERVDQRLSGMAARIAEIEVRQVVDAEVVPPDQVEKEENSQFENSEDEDPMRGDGS